MEWDGGIRWKDFWRPFFLEYSRMLHELFGCRLTGSGSSAEEPGFLVLLAEQFLGRKVGLRT